jgi:hypothetical protein
MSMPPLQTFADEMACFSHYEKVYCAGPISTFDGIMVRFNKRDFLHLFYESSDRSGAKDVFSTRRAARIDWIKTALQDPNADVVQGWDNIKKTHTPDRRVCIVSGNYVVIIRITDVDKANILTAFVIDDPNVLTKLKSAPKWP